VAALALAAMTMWPAGPAGAKALPKPRNEEWQFAAWEIENKVWPITRGQGVTVAVIDTGVNASLPGLSGVVLPGADVRRGGHGDGRTDTDTGITKGHGTQMAELIAGQGQDDGMVGIAPEVKILPIVADGSPDTMATALRYAVDHGAKVINVSLGNADDEGPTCVAFAPEVQDAVTYAAQKNVVVVAAAGNKGNTINDPNWPADCPGVLAVGAVDHKKVPWTHTEQQPYVAVAAPGYAVGSVGKAGHFFSASGTSGASALTSAVVALVRAKFPQMSAREVVQRIINTTVDAWKPGVDDATGKGIVIPAQALEQDIDKSAPNPPYDRLDKWLASKGKKVGSGSSQAGKPAAAKKSGSNSGLVAVIVVVAILAVIAAVIVAVLLLRRRRGGSQPVVQEQWPSPGGPGQFPQGPGGDGRMGGPPGPPPAFRPPESRGGPHR
jgi:type VII secretion-associated serine protease mycosin